MGGRGRYGDVLREPGRDRRDGRGGDVAPGSTARSSSWIWRYLRTSSAAPAFVPGVRLFDVDDLRAGLDGAIGSRLAEVPSVEAIVEDEVEGFGRRYRELEVEPLVASFRRRAEAIRREEVDRALRHLGDLDPEIAERIEHLSRALVKKLLHEPTVRLRQHAASEDMDEVAASIRELFGPPAPHDP